MYTIYRHEMKIYLKSLLIWAICVGGMGFGCILLYSSMQQSIQDMADGFASMGAFSDAFGMSQLSIATLTGFYATEVGVIHTLGGAMFAAILAGGILTKEEDGHTGEFLFSLPVTRHQAAAAKWCAAASHVFLFNVLCVGFYLCGIAILGEEIAVSEFLLYHFMQLLMQEEIAAICFMLSAFMRKIRLGTGLGIVLLFYAFDLIARVIPDLSDYKAVSPFSYANAADILSSGKIDAAATVIGAAVLVAAVLAAHLVYARKDLAA